ncbi:hypothetical protein Lal_00019284 [Lupinus albus]|uniref:Putative triacylglycerol lipase n=1 Tax=Lupinus albus TaxID=3870 RepID=A0A6A4R4G1_LUPAL|nr:putative triacylglycerol lipase [Lupinus albus]KAF1899162.1 hypothetical protein Lal_00019284 [Lupinus albus]
MWYSISCFLLMVVVLNVGNGEPLVPALFIFGDSIVDMGNNNDRYTVVKATFPPYGRDFENHSPTGRFCNGKLATDFTAQTLGFTSYPPPYFNLKEKGSNLLNGANFASAGCGYYDSTSKLYNLYALGARRIGVPTLPPMGCLPASITLFGFSSNKCVTRLNNDAINFNVKLNTISQNLKNILPELNLVLLDIYQPLYDLVTKYSENGFFEARKACCGSGLLELAILCNKTVIGTCVNASQYSGMDFIQQRQQTRFWPII